MNWAPVLLWTMPFWIVPALVVTMLALVMLRFVLRLAWYSIEEILR